MRCRQQNLHVWTYALLCLNVLDAAGDSSTMLTSPDHLEDALVGMDAAVTDSVAVIHALCESVADVKLKFRQFKKAVRQQHGHPRRCLKHLYMLLYYCCCCRYLYYHRVRYCYCHNIRCLCMALKVNDTPACHSLCVGGKTDERMGDSHKRQASGTQDVCRWHFR